MDNKEVLDHLLKVESEAAALVDAAQTEADRRLADGEKENQAAYDGRYHKAAERLESDFTQTKERARLECQKELEAYKEKISSISVDTEGFFNLLNRLLEEQEAAK